MNTIPDFKPIVYGTHQIRNPKTEEAIRFLEDPQNNSKPLPPNLFAAHERKWIEDNGRAEYAQLLRESLQGGVIG